MKVRAGFVSNSSSSSFVVRREDINAKQLYQIIHHEELAESFGLYCSDGSSWSIEDDLSEVVKGSTWMDNFNMRAFMDCIGIDMDKVKWV